MRVPHSSIPTKELNDLRARIAELEETIQQAPDLGEP